MKYVIGTLAVIVAALFGVVAASCGVENGAESAGPVPTGASGGDIAGASGTVSTLDTGGSSTSEGSGGLVTYEVWFTRGEFLFMVKRTQEQAAAVGSQIPAGTQLLGLNVDGGIATVDLTSEFESGGGSASMNMRIAQVVYTLTQFPTVKGVLFQLDGQRVDVLGGEGVIVDQPVTRKDYRSLLPAILVESPQIGETVGNPVTVSGSANVFEANVTVEIVDASGKVLRSAYTTATCGTGCRGTFSIDLTYDVPSETRGLIIVSDDDAAGTGTSPHEVRIPVVLTPSS
jgi:hypothetical protein